MTSKAQLKRVLAEIRRLVHDGRFLFTEHCIHESLADEFFSQSDALNALLSGWIEREEWDGIFNVEKYVIYGYALDNRSIAVVVRFDVDEQGKLLIVITAWEIFFEDEN